MTTLANYTALRGYTYSSGNESVFVQGYSSTGDGGQGLFYWDALNTIPDNDGTIIGTASSGRWVRLFDGAINSKWFGTKGDGTTDDRVALTNAITAAAKVVNRSLFIPKGVYSIQSTPSSSTTSITVNGSAIIDGLEIWGEKGTKIVSSITPASGSGNTLLRFQDGFKNVKISNIQFESTHGLTAGFTHGITLNSNTQQNIGTQILDCSFTGFSQALFINGSQQLLINKCRFFSPLGHDNAQTTTDPAVYIDFTNNVNGVNISPTITDCYAEGFSGDISSFTNALDGFIFGNPSGAVITSNVMRNFSQEAIFIQPNLFVDSNNPTDRPTLICNNIIQYDLPKGSGNYGIRCDASNIDINNNIIINENYGIFCYGFTYSTKFTNLRIANNNISISPNGTAQRGVYVQGTPTAKTDNLIISGNHFTLSGVTVTSNINLITVADCEKSILDKNTINIIGTTGMDATHQLNIYALLNNNDSIILGSGSISGTYSNLYVFGTGSNTNIAYLNPTKENVLFINSTYSVSSNDFAITKSSSLILYADSTSAGFVITLPTGAYFDGYRVTIIKTNSAVSNTITIANTTGPNTLINQGQSLDLVFNSATNNWWVA